MLVLTRRRDERIMVGDNILIMVVDIDGDSVRLGIVAPPDTEVHREEVYLEVQRINRRPAPSSQ